MADNTTGQGSWLLSDAVRLGVLLLLLTVFTYFKIGTTRWLWIVGLLATTLLLTVTPAVSWIAGSRKVGRQFAALLLAPSLVAGCLCLVLFKALDLGGPAPRAAAPAANVARSPSPTPTPAKPRASAPVIPNENR